MPKVPDLIPNEPVGEALDALLKKIEEQLQLKIVQAATLVTVVHPDGSWSTVTLTRMISPVPMQTSLPDLQMLEYLTDIVTYREKERFAKRLENGEATAP